MRRYIVPIVFALIALHLSLQFTAGVGWYHHIEYIADRYDCLARNLLQGQYIDCNGLSPTAYRLPGYPVFLAATFGAIGDSVAIARLLQSVMAACSVFMVCAFTQRLGGSMLVAGAVACISWGLYNFASLLMTEGLFSLVLLFFVATLTYKHYRTSGALLGVLFLTRGTIYFTFPFLLLLIPRRYWLRFALPCLAIVGGWIARNAVVMNMAGLSTNGGITFEVTNNELIYGRANGGQEFTGLPFYVGENEVAQDRTAYTQTFAFIRSVPFPVLIINAIAKEARLWGFFEETETKLPVLAFMSIAVARFTLWLYWRWRRVRMPRSFGATGAYVTHSNR